MKLSNNAKYKYLKFFGALCIAFGVISGFDALSVFNDPNITVNVNGVDRTDVEAKLLVLFYPVLMIVIGIVLNLISYQDVSKINKARNTFWSIFRK